MFQPGSLRPIGLTFAVVVAGGVPSQSQQRTEAPTRVETAHLTITTTAGAPRVAAGARISLVVDITPKPGIHVYAPGEKDAVPVILTLASSDAFAARAAVFPRPEKYYFAPLKLTQLVYSKPFRIIQDLTVAASPSVRERARADGAQLTIDATLRYQACDDKVCYIPKTVPLSWTIPFAAGAAKD
jgi:DsbC/DsbD-like thiol-disulfide interchange protein